ncbi:MAG: CsgG/HfaB family protein [Treponema sp.]|jgi:TolB-like protein|nr:CsgG/HfaB family protein [Treponema sp.]
MKQKPFWARICILAALCAGCAGFSAAGGSDDLDAAIRETSDYLNGRLPPGNKLVFLNFQSASPPLSEYIIDGLIEHTVNDRVFAVVDRANLALIQQEMNFQLSGEVSDESAQAIGQKLGAQIIVSGAIAPLGNAWRLRVRAIGVETAEIQGQFNRDIAAGRRIRDLTGAQLGEPPDEPIQPVAGEENLASSRVSAQGQGFEQLGGARLQMAYAAHRKFLRDNEGKVTQFKVLSVNRLINIYGQRTSGCLVIRVDVNGNGRWDDNVDGTIMFSHTSKIYSNVQAGDVVSLPVPANDLEDDKVSGADRDALAAGQRVQAAGAQANDGPNLEYTIGKKFKGGLGYFKLSTDLYDEGLQPIAVFSPEDDRYGRIAPFAFVYNVKSSRDRDGIRDFLDGFRGNLAGNNPHLYAARNILSVHRILAVNGVPVEFMDEIKPEERAKLIQESYENSLKIREFYASNTK